MWLSGGVQNQSRLALCTLIKVGFLTPGRMMRCRDVGRPRFLNRPILTGRPVRADL
jgi:hypothetical protein